MNLSLENLIAQSLKGKEKKEQKSWHPSALGQCLTGVYLQRAGIPPDEEFDERTLRVFSVGKHFEDWLISLIKETDAEVETQVRIEWPEMDVTGYCDAVINGTPYEFKSKHSKAFWYMEREGAPPLQNRMQLWLYLKVLDKETGRLCFVSKDDLTIAEYIVLRDDTELEEKVVNELSILNKAWKEKLPPPVTYKLDSWQAKYCRWHLKCIIR